MKKIILMLALCLMLCVAADARYPKVGDRVQVSCNIGNGPIVSYQGHITDISDGLICLNCTNVVSTSGQGFSSSIIERESVPLDVCIGTGQISMLIWMADGGAKA